MGGDEMSSALILLVTFMMISSAGVDATLRVDYYNKCCPNVEKIVYREMREAYQKDRTVAPGVLRVHFHDCFVRGCDGSLLLSGNNTEKAALINSGLRGFDAIDAAKAAVEKACPGVVSCADILAFAARDSVVLTGGARWEVPAGRRDGRVSLASEPPLNLPRPTMKTSDLIQTFKKKGLTAEQMVDLSGAHTIGISHCFFITDRLYNYPSKSHVDPTYPKSFAKSLKKKCPSISSVNPIPMDFVSPGKFNPQYFINIKNKKGLMTSDQTLLNDPRTRPTVLKNLKAHTFNKRFGAAMVAMSRISPLTGKAGEIRKHCQFVN